MTELRELEKQKLREEIRELKRPWYVKPSVWVSVVTTLVAAYSLIIQYQRTEVATERWQIQKEQAQLDAAKAERDLQINRELQAQILLETQILAEQHGQEQQRLADVRAAVLEAETLLDRLEQQIGSSEDIQVVRQSLQSAREATEQLLVNVVDVGPGLCVVVKAPPEHVAVYDAGPAGGYCLRAAEAISPGKTIDTLVLSHGDFDHIGAAADLVQGFELKRIVWNSMPQEHRAWTVVNDAIAVAKANGVEVLDSYETQLRPGTSWSLGDATLTVVAAARGTDCTVEGAAAIGNRNRTSIVVRLDYGGRSLLLPGDATSDMGNPPGCVSTERAMLLNNADVPIRADVLVAPYHGSRMSSSYEFIEAVDPSWVIFSAGHRFGHPSAETVTRYQDLGVRRFFRTDRGDNEGGRESNIESIAGCSDQAGDDNVIVAITPDSLVSVRYEQPNAGC